ncbi:transposase [Streptomyces sp. MS1.AVA.4]|uniref:Transposase n=1 Tax=Streptomyces pratisoli TaxID=3139917 RepID=A0ACC6QKN0_9ACTN
MSRSARTHLEVGRTSRTGYGQAGDRGPGRGAGDRALRQAGRGPDLEEDIRPSRADGFVDHCPGGTGEPVAALLRPGNAGANTASDHITATRLALAQLPRKYRRGRQTLIRCDSGGGTHDFVAWLAQRGRRLSYSVDMVGTDTIHQHRMRIPASAWTPAVESNGEVRDGRMGRRTHRRRRGGMAGWDAVDRPQGTAASRSPVEEHGCGRHADHLLRHQHPGRPIAELELRHRLRARAEDRIRAARSTSLRNLPLHDTAQNELLLEIVQIALDPLAWMPMLALTGQTRLWEPRRLRFRLFSAAGQLITTGRRRILRLAHHWPWIPEITTALERLALLPNPG